METLTIEMQHPSRRFLFVFFFALVFGVVVPCSSDAQTKKRIVELHIYFTGRAQVGTQQSWMETLSQVGADRVTNGRGAITEPSVETDKLGMTEIVTVHGIVNGGQLYVPNQKFSVRDRIAMTDYVQALRDDGANIALAEKKAFGLTSQQLVDVHGRLSSKIDFETTGLEGKKFSERILLSPNSPFVITKSVQGMINGTGTIGNEWKGLSIGTATAAILKPIGLGIVPQQLPGQPLEIQIVEIADASEYWPVGWPPERAPVNVEPRIFDRLDIEIRDYPLRQVLDAIQQRCKVPFLYDAESVTAEIHQTKVTLVQKQASYMVAIGKVLRQTKPRLDKELKVDENGTPFLWIFARE